MQFDRDMIRSIYKMLLIKKWTATQLKEDVRVYLGNFSDDCSPYRTWEEHFHDALVKYIK